MSTSTSIRRVFLSIAALGLLHAPLPGARMTSEAPPLPEPTGKIVRVSTVQELQNAVASIESGATILVEPGEYRLTRALVFDEADSVALRGATGQRADVVIRGRGMTNSDYGNVPSVIMVQNVSDILIADLTIEGAWYHNMHLAGDRGPLRPRIYNVRSLDCGEQHLKVNPGYNPIVFPDSGVVEYCRFEFTDRAKHWYTNGVDVLDGAGWVVRDCEFIRIRGPVGVLAGSAVLFWHTCYNSIVERCFFYECDFGITLGLGGGPGNSKRSPDSEWDHIGGIVRNNIIFRRQDGDTGISVNHARDFRIANNTVILNSTFPWNIEYRFDNSTGEVKNNLTDGPIMQRDNARAELAGNVTDAAPSWFADFDSVDLHLDSTASGAIDRGVPLDYVEHDYDLGLRPEGPAPDAGADEFGSVPAARGDLDRDGDVDIFDLLGLLRAMVTGGSTAATDLDRDGDTDIFDLLEILGLLAGT